MHCRERDSERWKMKVIAVEFRVGEGRSSFVSRFERSSFLFLFEFPIFPRSSPRSPFADYLSFSLMMKVDWSWVRLARVFLSVFVFFFCFLFFVFFVFLVFCFFCFLCFSFLCYGTEWVRKKLHGSFSLPISFFIAVFFFFPFLFYFLRFRFRFFVLINI